MRTLCSYAASLPSFSFFLQNNLKLEYSVRVFLKKEYRGKVSRETKRISLD